MKKQEKYIFLTKKLPESAARLCYKFFANNLANFSFFFIFGVNIGKTFEWIGLGSFQAKIAESPLFLPAAIADRSSNTPSCCCWGGFFCPLDNLVAQSSTNNLCRSQISKNPDL